MQLLTANFEWISLITWQTCTNRTVIDSTAFCIDSTDTITGIDTSVSSADLVSVTMEILMTFFTSNVGIAIETFFTNANAIGAIGIDFSVFATRVWITGVFWFWIQLA